MANLLSTTVNGQLNTGNVIDLGYTVNGSIATTAFRGINFHSFGDLNYYIGKPSGAWTQPLHIHFYTGIWIRSHHSYGGTRFYNIATGSNLMSIGDGADNINVYAKITSSITSGTVLSHGSMDDAIGWNSSYGTYIGSTVGGTYYIYGNGRFYDNGTIRTLIHSGNIGSQSVSYATTANVANFFGGFTAYGLVEEARGVHSVSDFPNGTLVTTDIAANEFAGDSFVMEVSGKSYGSGTPFKLAMEGYLYANTIINVSAMSYGSYFPAPVKVMNLDGTLAFWWPRGSYWNSFEVHVRAAGGESWNRVTGISDSVDPPSATKKISITPVQVIHTNNIGSQSVSYATSAGTSTTSTHLSARTDSEWYNVIWGAGNPSYMYSSDSVRIRSSDGALRANIYYDNQDTAYYGDFASLSRVNEIGANKMRADTNGNFSTDQGWWSHDPYGYGWGKPHGSFRTLEVSSSGNFSTEPAMFRIHQWGSGAAEFWKPQGRTLYLRETPGGSGTWFDTFEVQGLTTTTSFGLTNGFRITSGGSNYGRFNSWVHLPGAHGFYSDVNGAHIYPNNGSHGAWRISGTRGGWNGIEFDASNGNVSLMVNPNSNTTGFHNNAYGWQFYWENGTLYCNKNSYGAGTTATVLDSSNYTSYTLPRGGSWYGSGLPGSRWGGFSVSGGEIVFGDGLPNAGQMGILIDGAYLAGENNGFWSLASDNSWSSRRGMYWDGTYLNFTANSAVSLFSDILVSSTSNTPINITGAAHKYITINPGNGWEAMVRYIGGSGSSWYVGKRTASQVVGTESFHFYSEAAGQTVGGIDTGGNMIVTGSMRAPIFYDSNDTGYYLDPNGGSNLNDVTANQFYANGWFRNNTINQGLYQQAGGGNHFYAEDSNVWTIAANGSYPQIRFRSGGHQGTIRGYVYADTSNQIGFLNNGGGWNFRTTSDKNAFVHGQTLTINADNAGWSSIFMNDGDEGAREIHCNSNRIGFLTQAGSWGAYLDDSTNWYAAGSMQAPIFYDSADTAYYLDPNGDTSLKVYGEISNSNYQTGRLQPGALNIGRTDTNYAWDGTSWSDDIRLGILANTNETWEMAIHDSGDSVMSVVHYDGGNTLSFGRNLSWGNCYVNAQAGYISNSNPWGTNNSAFFPNGITTAGGTNWIYGFTYIGNAPGNGNGHEFNANGTQYSTASITTPTFIVNSHSDNTRGYRIHNTSGTSVSAMFTNSSNALVIAAGAFDQINLNKKVYVNGVALGVNVTPSSTAGRIDASNDIVAYSSSDERLKYNITPIENAIDKVKSLIGVEFDWKPEYKHAHGYEGHDTGIIAQQVQEVIPSAVRTNDTGFLAVRYEKLIGLLVEGMKEQQAQIEELKAKLDGLTK